MSNPNYSLKQLRKLARDVIELETSYLVVCIVECNAESGSVIIKCRTTFGNEVDIKTVFRDGKVRLEAPGMGTLLVKSMAV